MMAFFTHAMAPWITAYGSVAVALLILLESVGLPLPGETALVSAAIYAGTTHRIDIVVLILFAAAGATLGGALGYWIGRNAGYPVLLRHGRHIGLTERRLLAGHWLFEHHGGKIVIIGRFFAIMRALAALLAGVTMMDWRRFIAFQTVACLLWATVYGGIAYDFGKQINRFAGPLGIAAAIIIVAVGIIMVVIARRHGDRLEAAAAARARVPELQRPGER